MIKNLLNILERFYLKFKIKTMVVVKSKRKKKREKIIVTIESKK